MLINHNIRKDSKQEANKVKLLLKKNGLNLNILSNYSKIEKNIQSQARTIRYNLLKNFCKKKKIDIILTAHNLEDQVETFFIRLSRGSGITGLSAMENLSYLNGKIRLCRPLLDVRKKTLKKISKSIFKKYIKDPSNKNIKYLRTKIRNLEKPLKQSGINYDQIIKSINNLASTKDIIDDYYNKIFKDITKISKKEVHIYLGDFMKLQGEIKIRVINESIKKLKKNYYNPRSRKVLNLIKKIKSNKFKSSTLGGCIFTKKNQYLSLKLEKN